MIRLSRLPVSLVSLMAATLLLAACSTAPSSRSASVPEASGVQGTSMIAGGGVEGVLPATARPFPGVIAAARRRPLRQDPWRRSGPTPRERSKLDLAPGTYTLRQMMSGPPRTVTVRPGQYLTVALLIQALEARPGQQGRINPTRTVRA